MEVTIARPRLAIVWPTYNGAEYIKEHLEQLLPEIMKLNVAVYISDDSMDDRTKEAVEAIADGQFAIYYRRNTPSLGHDANLVSALGWADADYVWLIRDKMRPVAGVIPMVLAFLQDQDMVFVNVHSDDFRMITSVSGEEARLLVRDALWQQTLTGATIYARRVAKRAFDLTTWPNFPQVSLILDQLQDARVTIGLFGKRSLATVRNEGQSYWRNKALSVFGYDWATVVTAYPQVILPAEQSDVIRSHSARMNYFNANMMYELKHSGQFTLASIRYSWFQQAMHLSRARLLLILLTPRLLFRALRKALSFAR